MKKFTKKQPGFTFVELLFAIVVMGTMFSLALVVFIGMLRFYVFAGTVRQNQENSRNVLTSISKEIRFGELLVPNTSQLSGNSVCVYNNDTNKTVLIEFSSNTIKKYESKSTFATLALAKTQLSSSACSISDTQSDIYNLLPPNSYVVSFNINLTRGAKSEAFTDVAAVTINLVNITKSSNSVLVDGNKCNPKDIYCNSLTLNTAVGIRGGE